MTNSIKRLSSFQREQLILIVILISIFFSINSFAQVSGTVFRDTPLYDTNEFISGIPLAQYGVQKPNEIGIEGVTVTAYTSGVTTTTIAYDSYSFTAVDAPIGATRILTPWLESSPESGVGNASVQFVSAPAVGINFGLHYPADFIGEPDPKFVLPIMYSGDNLIDSNGMDSPSHKYDLTMLVANMEYTLTVPTIFGGDDLVIANTGEESSTDINDSDADTVTGVATVLATAIPILGANNHTFDFGYGPPPPCPPTRCGTILTVEN